MKNYIWAAVLAAGIACCGAFIYSGISKYAEKDRCVTVKGLSEREVMANRVIWPMRISVQGESLEPLYDQLAAKQKAVQDFLTSNKVPVTDITVSSPSVSDRWEYSYDECIKKHQARYQLSADITVTSRDVPKIINLLNSQLELRKKGVDISTDDYAVQYDYVDLSSLKPEMVEEATKNARSVAQKFAEDAECQLGGIINATQGQFTIDDDYHRPAYKKIRVVTTVAYYLK